MERYLGRVNIAPGRVGAGHPVHRELALGHIVARLGGV